MVSNDICNEFRQSVDDIGIVAVSSSLGDHINHCAACAQWQEQSQSISLLVAAMPQFDVSEQLTQRILTAIPRQSPSLINSSFLLPLAVVSVAVLGSALPFESVEGIASSAVSLFAMFAIHWLIKSAPTEDMAT